MIKHKLNQSFEWLDREGPFRVVSEEQARQYDELGFVVMEDVFDSEVISALIKELDPIERALEKVVEERFGGKIFISRSKEITFTPHAVTRSPKARELTQSPFFRDLVHDLLGNDVRLYWDQAVYKKPGTVDIFPWHQDNGYTYVEPQQYLTCWLALTDTDEQNGCPIVLPRQHREGTWAHEQTDLGFDCGVEEALHEPVVAPLRAGSMVVFSSLTPHKTGPNLTKDQIRKSYIIQFAPDGAELLMEEGGEWTRATCDAPDRQYPILVGGEAPSETIES